MKNNMMKKLLTLVLAGAMTLSLAACGAKTPATPAGQRDGRQAPQLPCCDHQAARPRLLDEIANAVAAELDQLAQRRA